jgi:hypothetical protein
MDVARVVCAAGSSLVSACPFIAPSCACFRAIASNIVCSRRTLAAALSCSGVGFFNEPFGRPRPLFGVQVFEELATQRWLELPMVRQPVGLSGASPPAAVSFLVQQGDKLGGV